MSAPVTGLTVRKTVTLACSAEHAFATFTEGIDAWWPLEKYSVGRARARRAIFEGKDGGRIYEVWDDGAEREWGSVLVWDPPRRVVYSWQPDPERPAPTEVEVRFVPEGEGTRVELEHRGWERLGDSAGEAREGYDSGWDVVLGRYAAQASG